MGGGWGRGALWIFGLSFLLFSLFSTYISKFSFSVKTSGGFFLHFPTLFFTIPFFFLFRHWVARLTEYKRFSFCFSWIIFGTRAGKGDMLGWGHFLFLLPLLIFFCFIMFRMHRLCLRETAGFYHSLAFLCYLWAFMHIKGVWFSHAFSFLSFVSQIQPSRKK